MNETPENAQELSPLKRALVAVKDMRAKLDAVEKAKTEPIAVVGLACRFPGGADTPDALWELLRNGVDAVTEIPPDRWDVNAYYDPDPEAPGKMYTRQGGFLKDIDQFDPQFFGISPREAASMDPQQRLLLEVAWEALENAGQSPDKLAGSQAGVFLGISTNDYQQLQLDAGGLNIIDPYVGTGGAFNVAAGRISYVLGWHGPAMSLDTACSSSLVAVHLAVQNLRAGQCHLALAGGVNIMLRPEANVYFSKVRAMAADGRCKTFDAAADGYVRGEGCGLVVLKRLSDALADRDNILALIRGAAINHDGRSSGLTVPNGQAQQAVIRLALADAGGLEPAQVDYVEAHGTGTPLGDPIEVRALAAALGPGRPAASPLLLGSMKTNIGHMEAAAGIGGVFKLVLALQHQEIPQHLHLRNPSPHIDWANLPVRVTTQNTPWPSGDKPRIAGINSFGFSGTNAHAIFEEAPAREAIPSMVDRPTHLLAVSAKGETALRELARRFANSLSQDPSGFGNPKGLADICFTANTGRAHFANRAAFTANSPEQMREKLLAFADGQSFVATAKGQLKIAFLFTGQGAQYAGMARQLYETQPTFRKTLDKCDEILRPLLNQSLIALLHSSQPSLLDQTAYTQPALFAVEYALAELWKSWGVTPSAVLGHSVGEYVAACVAGVFSLEDGLKLIAERGRLMGALPAGGEMVAIFADEAKVAEAVAPFADRVSIAAVNGPKSIVISGAGEAVQAIVKSLEGQGFKSKRLTVSHAFHSPLMAPMLDEFEQVASGVKFAAPRIRLVSNVTGQVQDGAPGVAYWRRHVRQAVRFSDSIETLRGQGYDVFVEIGPKPTLTSMGQQCWPDGAQSATWLPSLREGRDDWQVMLDSLGALYVQGANVDWDGLDRDYVQARRRVVLPNYPFQRARYWFKQDETPQPKSGVLTQPSTAIHPLLHQRVQSPLIKDIVFESGVSADRPPFLSDHRIYGAPIFPATAYLEMALAAANTFGAERPVIESVSIHEPLALPESTGEAQTVQLILTPEGDDNASFQILSLIEAENKARSFNAAAAWKLHATGKLRFGPAVPSGDRVALAELRARCEEGVNVEAYYQRLREQGLNYGPSFQGVKELWRRDGEAWGEIQLPADVGDVPLYHLHPALLDSCLHLLGAALLPKEILESAEARSGDIYLPVGIGQLRVYNRARSRVWSQVTIQPGENKETYSGSVRLFDEGGALIAELDGLVVRRASREILRRLSQKRFDDWLYEVAWRPKALSESKEPASGSWLVFADRSGLGQALATRLKERGATCNLVVQGEAYATTANGWQINASRPDDFARLLKESGPRRVAYLWSAEGDAAEAATLGVLYLTQALAASGNGGGLWLVTRGAQAVTNRSLAVSQSPVLGLGKVIALEHPDLHCVCVDIDPAGEADSAGALFTELVAGDGEAQVVLRGNTRYVARLARLAKHGGRTPQPFEMEITSRGVLDNIALKPQTRRAPGPGEVEIEVRASGLNFRDVLNVLGMYPGDPGQPGLECAGTIVAVGDGVADFKVGDSVLAIAPRAFSSYVVTRAEFVALKPAHLSFAEAATIPVTFLTVLYGFKHLAKMKRGARVLIHAAAGGVGLAAVQLAQQAGAEIFGTAGSPEKQAHLKSLGVQHVMSSRTLDFADEIMRVTNGQGVDVVLNALADDFIAKSVSVLADNGCFLEIGKRGIWSEEQMKAARPGASYFPYDLGTVLQNDPALIQEMFRELMAGLADNTLRPLPLQAFSSHQVADAFRYMAQAKHIGKVVVMHETGGHVRPEAGYLITGGLGGLGLTVARWLVERGARHLALAGRSGPSESARKAVTELEEAGAQVVALQADMSQKEQVANMLAELAQTMPPLCGVIHAAGALDDGVLSQQDRDRFAKVMGPKVNGAAALHELTRGLPLDFFVLFSSASSLLGSPGQGNYAAANAFMDALAHERRARGLPALSVNWGAWGEVGMAAGLGGREQRRLAEQGLGQILPEQGVQALAQALQLGLPQVGVLPINWTRMAQQFPAGSVPPLFSEVVSQAQAGKGGPLPDKQAEFKRALEAAPADQRQELLTGFVRDQVVKVLGLPSPEALDLSQPLTDAGLDSLMAIELKNRIESGLGMSLAVSNFVEGPSIAELAQRVLAQMGTPVSAGPTEERQGNGQDGEAAQLLARLDQLSDDEVDSLLNTMLLNGETRI
jgi:myxalamid-type polyketide synthase MxaB